MIATLSPQKLAERYRPSSLAGIVGQPPVAILRAFAAQPYSSCWLLSGEPGIGKSASALALANDLGSTDPWSGLEIVSASDLGKDEVDRQLKRLWHTTLSGSPFNVLIVEELERLSPQAQVSLKVGLASENLPPRAVVVATSNDTTAIDEALLERFTRLEFRGWERLAKAGFSRVVEIWRQETDAPLPAEAVNWGWHFVQGKKTRFSMRRALDEAQLALLLASAESEYAA